jgi:hypothetical protein
MSRSGDLPAQSNHVHSSSASSLKDKAKVLFEAGKLRQAIDCYEEGASLYPFDPCEPTRSFLFAHELVVFSFCPLSLIFLFQRGTSTLHSPISSSAMPVHASLLLIALFMSATSKFSPLSHFREPSLPHNPRAAATKLRLPKRVSARVRV